MKSSPIRVAVASRSFSKHPILRQELQSKYRHVTFNDSGKTYQGADLINFLSGHDKAITGLEAIDDSVLRQLPDLKLIAKYGVGLDMLDFEAFQRHGVLLGWKGGVNKRSVSELALCFMIALLREVPVANLEMRAQVWKQHVGRLLSSKCVGIIGCGHVGKDLVRLLQPFGCRIFAHDIVDYPDFNKEHNVLRVNLDELLVSSDVVTLHVPLNTSTHNLINRERLVQMKRASILINTARGGLVDEVALKERLVSGDIAAAAFDVFSIEPPENLDLVNLPNFYCTPHLGGSAEEAILAMGRAAIESLEQGLTVDNYQK